MADNTDIGSAHPAAADVFQAIMDSCFPAELVAAASERLEDIEKFLHEPKQQELLAKQAHLDADSAERAYWHAGYASALQDLLVLIQKSARAA